MFDVFYIGNNDELLEHIPFAKGAYSINPTTRMYWLIDPDTQITDYTIFDFRPEVYDQDYTHVYPNGLRLVPVTSEGEKHIAKDVCRKKFGVVRGSDPTEYFQNNPASRHVWVIDEEYIIDEDINWVPKEGDGTGVFIFKMPGQLDHKYPTDITEISDARCGGIKLYANNFNLDKKFVNESPFTIPVFPVYAEIPDNADYPYFWLKDPDYEFTGVPIWVPDYSQRDNIHVFKVPGFLDERYPLDITDPWDNRCGGLKFCPRDCTEETESIYQTANPVKFEMAGNKFYKGVYEPEEQYYKNDIVLNGAKMFKASKDTVPPGGFHLAHWTIVDYIPVDEKYLIYETEEQGRLESKQDWFWVVDPSVSPLASFTFDYVPTLYDEGKMHVWQLENPVTGLVFDYAGVYLCPKVAKPGLRPRYMPSVAAKSVEYAIYYIPPKQLTGPLRGLYRRAATLTKSAGQNMFWMVDAFTQLPEGYAFDYYPTTHDQQYIHVFADEDGNHRNVRLVPSEMFLENEYTDEEIANNSFDNLKMMNEVASVKPKWPVYDWDCKKERLDELTQLCEEPFFWTIDENVIPNKELFDTGFMPALSDLDKVHVWQQANPRTDAVHAYGGVRLWRRDKKYDLTTEDITLNRIKDLHYVKELGSTAMPYDVVMISYHDDDAEEKFKKLQEKIPHAYMISDVDGIFEAHKEAAKAVHTEMFWVVDFDAEVVDTFDFSHIPDVYDREVTHVWTSSNPVTNDEYGYGGIKLFPTNLVREATNWGLDFTTGLSTRFKVMPEVACVTKFNTSPYETWKSAFRECVKLSLNDGGESKKRLKRWLLASGDAEFLSDAAQGAKDAVDFVHKYKNDLEELNKINDYEWLRARYTQNLAVS